MILNQTQPFCLSDIINKTDNKGLILDVLNELYDEGLVTYECIEENKYAFVTCYMSKKLVKSMYN